MENDYQIVDTALGLEKAVSALEKEKVIAVDLEADPMYHFKEKVCLIQLATEKTSVVVDPLQVNNFSLLRPLFSTPDIQMIFHGADYDVRRFYRDFKFKIINLFDTELASRFLGIKGTGLKAVLKMFFEVNIEKKYQKKDLSYRHVARGNVSSMLQRMCSIFNPLPSY